MDDTSYNRTKIKIKLLLCAKTLDKKGFEDIII